MAPRYVDRDGALAAVAELARSRTGLRLVGVDGFAGAGKTTLARRIAGAVPGAVIVHVDDFASVAGPEWDWERLRRELLVPLMQERPARYQVWGWDQRVGGKWIDVPPDSVVIIEGVSSTRSELAAPWDLTIWVDAPRDVRLARGIQRDGEAMRAVWEQVWIPSEERYAAREHPRERVDLVVNGAGG